MTHAALRLLAQLAIYGLMGFLPVLWILFTDRFRRPMSPDRYALLFALVALLGILLFIPAISIVAATALLAVGIAWLSGHFALSGLSYRRSLSPARLFVGDEASLEIRLDNRKLLPLAWLTVTDPLHLTAVRADRKLNELLRFSGGIEPMADLTPALVNSAAIGPYQALIRTYQIEGLHRGVYTLGPAQVASGDPFGFFRQEASLGGRQEIIVYPRLESLAEMKLPFREALGELVTRRALFEDPTLIAGSREYRPGDPLRLIHWKATARRGAGQGLQVRVSDPSTTAQLMIVLNLSTHQHLWEGVDMDRMEAVISVAASLAVWALDHDFPVGMRSNGIIPGHTHHSPRIPASANPRQSTYLLEHLARITFWGRFSPEQVLADESRRLGPGASIVFVTPLLTPAIIAVLTSRQLTGRVITVYCGRHAAPVVPGLPIYLATPPERQRAVS